MYVDYKVLWLLLFFWFYTNYWILLIHCYVVLNMIEYILLLRALWLSIPSGGYWFLKATYATICRSWSEPVSWLSEEELVTFLLCFVFCFVFATASHSLKLKPTAELRFKPMPGQALLLLLFFRVLLAMVIYYCNVLLTVTVYCQALVWVPVDVFCYRYYQPCFWMYSKDYGVWIMCLSIHGMCMIPLHFARTVCKIFYCSQEIPWKSVIFVIQFSICPC